MTTGKDYGLPDEYADWVEVPFHLVNIGDNYVTTHFIHYPNGPLDKGFSIVGIAKFFVPPKPKPTLPEVGPGAVISYRRKGHIPGGKNRARAIKNAEGWWTVYHEGLHGAPVYKAVASTYFSHKKFVWTADEWADRWFDEDLLASVDDDGFTVELDGLE